MNPRAPIPSGRLEARVQVPFSYPVLFCRDVFSPDQDTLCQALLPQPGAEAPPRVLVWLDAGLADAWPGLADRARAWFTARMPGLDLGRTAVFPGGEAVKDGWTHVHGMIRELNHHNLCRKSAVVAVGGGAFLDAAGLACALFHRGVNLVRLPSTVLSQNDSGVGVKNGINAEGKKNLLGAFAPPRAVVCDLDFLSTLPDDVMRDGLAESFKVAIIKDAAFFRFLCDNAPALSQGEPAALEESVVTTARLHVEHIAGGGDPFEMGVSRPLDFGHWAAHRLESLSGYALRHGQAVAVGLALDTCYARFSGLVTDRELEDILTGISASGLPVWNDLLEQRDASGQYAVLSGIEEFREHLGGRLAVTLPRGIGHRVEVDRMDTDLVIQCIASLKERAA